MAMRTLTDVDYSRFEMRLGDSVENLKKYLPDNVVYVGLVQLCHCSAYCEMCFARYGVETSRSYSGVHGALGGWYMDRFRGWEFMNLDVEKVNFISTNLKLKFGISFINECRQHILGRSICTRKKNTKAFVVACKKAGLEVNADKTKYKS